MLPVVTAPIVISVGMVATIVTDRCAGAPTVISPVKRVLPVETIIGEGIVMLTTTFLIVTSELAKKSSVVGAPSSTVVKLLDTVERFT